MCGHSIHAPFQTIGTRRTAVQAHVGVLRMLRGARERILEGGARGWRERVVAGHRKLVRLIVRLQGHRQLQYVLQAGAAACNDIGANRRIKCTHQRAIAAIKAVRHDRADVAIGVGVKRAVVHSRQIQFFVVEIQFDIELADR